MTRRTIEERRADARAAGAAARRASGKGPARKAFDVWWKRRRGVWLYRLKDAMQADFIAAWVEVDRQGQPPEPRPVEKPAPVRMTRAQQLDRLTASAGLFVMRRFDPERPAAEGFAEWCEVENVPGDMARAMRREFISAWNGRQEEIDEAREDAEREAERAARASDADDVRALAEMEGDD